MALVESICSPFLKSPTKLSTMRLVLCFLLLTLALCCYEGEYHLWSIQPQLLVSLPLWAVSKCMCDKVEDRERQSEISSNLLKAQIHSTNFLLPQQLGGGWGGQKGHYQQSSGNDFITGILLVVLFFSWLSLYLGRWLERALFHSIFQVCE